ncbi:hypothetical protein [Deinococcus arenicola]|uniref:Uncharacterized protein n=1 Tax=Deinococcus arenicola TaxID=2994950 RepID=A0ABU4DNX1_9DEIO|nr:hypothetical protein [Deinococcus sp. ZS9-10]MDV6374138.1 hypothetical protein [Deinococcus sp. ZS9-10]
MNPDQEQRDGLMADAQQAVYSQRRRISEVRAREQVGAAGWAQSTTLQDIIRTGQQGLAATDALRQIIHLTTEQIRTLTLAASSHERDGQAQALLSIVENGEEQLTAAQALEQLVCRALEDVARTPVNELNVSRLHGIHLRVQEQLGALGAIISAAQAQAQTLEQAGKLEQVLNDHQRHVDEIQRFSAAHEASALAEAGEGIVQRIGELDEAAPEQIKALTQIGEAVAVHMGETGASGETQASALEKLADEMHDRADELRGDEAEQEQSAKA